MSRSTPLWIGKDDDQAIPPRIRVRVFERANGHCQKCSRKIGSADKWQADHIIALANGGEHAEANLQCLCDWCHKGKTREDVAQKAVSARVRSKHLGIRPPSQMRSGGFPQREKQHSATRKIAKWSLLP